MDENSPPKICRTCLTDVGNFYPIFLSDQTTGINKHFADMIMSYASVQILTGDGLTEYICTMCASKVAQFYIFKLKCEESDTRLRAYHRNEPYILKKYEDDLSSNGGHDLEGGLGETDAEDPDYYIKDEMTQTTDTIECTLTPQQPLTPQDTKVFTEPPMTIVSDLKKIHTTPITYTMQEIHSIDLDKEDLLKINKRGRRPTIPRPAELLQCSHCNFKCGTEKELQRHLPRHDKDDQRQYECFTCGKKYITKSHLRRHLRGHDAIKEYKCKLCTKIFGSKPDLREHKKSHAGEKRYLCSICGKGFGHSGNLHQHMTRHNDFKPFVCSDCGKRFKRKHDLCDHLRSHAGIKPYTCSVCNRSYSTSGVLKKHMRIHTGEKPYECDVCKQRFSRAGVLKRHKRIHTGEKPYICTFCAKGFAQTSELTAHLRTHTGEKPYVCELCGQAFKQNSSLKAHRKKHLEKCV